MGVIGLEPTVLYTGEECTHCAAHITYFHTTDSETILSRNLLNLIISIDSIMDVAKVGGLIGDEVGDIEGQGYHRLRHSHKRSHKNKCAIFYHYLCQFFVLLTTLVTLVGLVTIAVQHRGTGAMSEAGNYTTLCTHFCCGDRKHSSSGGCGGWGGDSVGAEHKYF